MNQDSSILLESCIQNYALPIWKDKINEYYPKDTAKKYISKISESLKYDPHLTYVTMVDNLSYLDLISSGKKTQVKNDLIDKLSEKSESYKEVISSHEMLLHSNYSLEFLPIFKNFLSPRKDAEDVVKYLSKFEK